MNHDDDICNESGNRPFGDILEASASRRKFMSGGLAAAAGSFIAPNLASTGSADGDGGFRHKLHSC